MLCCDLLCFLNELFFVLNLEGAGLTVSDVDDQIVVATRHDAWKDEPFNASLFELSCDLNGRRQVVLLKAFLTSLPGPDDPRSSSRSTRCSLVVTANTIRGYFAVLICAEPPSRDFRAVVSLPAPVSVVDR